MSRLTLPPPNPEFDSPHPDPGVAWWAIVPFVVAVSALSFVTGLRMLLGR